MNTSNPQHLIPLPFAERQKSLNNISHRSKKRSGDPIIRNLFTAFGSIWVISGGKSGKMNRLAYQQKALVGGCVTDGVICPKPHRIGVLPLHFHDPVKTHSRLLQIKNPPTDVYDAKAGTVLDIIQSTGSSGPEWYNFQVASSPPFFTGSPPSRASNPVILDEQFGNDDANPFSPVVTSGGCVQGSFDRKPAPVRIEGFNCRESFSISALA